MSSPAAVCQQGRLIAIENERALVEVKAGRACQACRAGKGCGMSIFSGWFARGPVRLLLPLQPGWRSGDRIELQISSGALLRLSWTAYGLPLLLLLAGMAGGVLAATLASLDQDLAAACGGAVGLAAGIALIRRQARFEWSVNAVRCGSGSDGHRVN